MKKRIILPVIFIVLIIGIFAFRSNPASANGPYDSGKWVAVYGGGEDPQSCKCVGTLTDNDCVTGDTTSNLNLCGGGIPPP